MTQIRQLLDARVHNEDSKEMPAVKSSIDYIWKFLNDYINHSEEKTRALAEQNELLRKELASGLKELFQFRKSLKLSRLDKLIFGKK